MRSFKELAMTLNNDIMNLDDDIKNIVDGFLRKPFELEREDCVRVFTDLVKHHATEDDLTDLKIVYGENALASIEMVKHIDRDATTVYIDWNDGCSDSYEYDLPLSRMIKINRDIRITRVDF